MHQKKHRRAKGNRQKGKRENLQKESLETAESGESKRIGPGEKKEMPAEKF